MLQCNFKIGLNFNIINYKFHHIFNKLYQRIFYYHLNLSNLWLINFYLLKIIRMILDFILIVVKNLLHEI